MTIVDLSSYDDISKDWFRLLADIIANNVVGFAAEKVAEYAAIGGAQVVAQIADGKGSTIEQTVDNAIGGVIGGLSTVLAKNIETPPILNYYRFRINPTRLNIANNKMTTITEYGRDKFDVESWGNKLAVYTYNATTGSLVPDPDLIKYGVNDIRLSKAWRKLEEFKRFYVLKSKKVLILFEDEMVEGIFQKFDFTRNADLPWRIDFNFVLMVDLASSRNTLTGRQNYPDLKENAKNSWSETAKESGDKFSMADAESIQKKISLF